MTGGPLPSGVRPCGPGATTDDWGQTLRTPVAPVELKGAVEGEEQRPSLQSQAEAHYKGNRHARRVKGMETSKSGRSPDADKTQPPLLVCPPTPGPSPCSPGPEPSREGERTHASRPQPTLALPGGDWPLLLSSGQTPPPPPPPAPTGSPGPGVVAPGDLTVTGPPDDASPAPSLAPSPASGDSEEDKAKKLLYCSLCKVAVNSLSQLEAHNKGTKHKTIQEARSGLGPIKAYPRLGPRVPGEPGASPNSEANSEERTFHCEICNVRVNSELQLKQHISSRRHRDGVAGKPNPLLSRHKKLREFMPTLSFSKDLPKNLGAGLLPNPLAVAAAMAAAASNNQLAQLRAACPGAHPHPHHPHHHHPHHAHLLQGTPLSLLRPAPGPMRTAHGPILFAPY
ncbi:zinc finger protein 385A-like [Gadus chalcogrammus]|uniref:zinc finger protein 385A-like n=1 Tax=Gadus chalcogrammus TaxID=1042646 RepID=UPI0024C49168|nr:zinc finger protein 385A-like [Gadus chalcogrammus]